MAENLPDTNVGNIEYIRKESDWIAILNATCIIVNYTALVTR